MKNKPLTNKTGKVRELSPEDIRAMRPAAQVLPAELLVALPKRKPGECGPQKHPTKIAITLRYSPEVIEYFRSMGKGWQVRMDKVLKEWMMKHPRRIARIK